jgi:hypothetical protein
MVRKILFAVIISVLGAIVTLFLIKKIFIDRVHIEKTNTNIIAIMDENLLKTYQINVDVFINYAGKYVGIKPFIVQAGFDLNKAQILPNQDGYIINLPKPEILTLQEDPQGKTIWIKKSKDDTFLKQFKIYGEIQAKYVALENKILEHANEHAKKFLPKFFSGLGIKVTVNTTEPERIEYVKISSKRCGVDLKMPIEFAKDFKIENWDEKVKRACLHFVSSDKRVEAYLYPSPLRWKTHFEDKELNQFSVFNPDLEYTMQFFQNIRTGFPFVRFYYQIADKNLIFEWVPKGPNDLKKKLPVMMFLASSVKDNGYTITETHDCFGITKSQWEKASIEEKRQLVSSYFFGSDLYFDKSALLLTSKINWNNRSRYADILINKVRKALKGKLHETSFCQKVRDHLLLLVYVRPFSNISSKILGWFNKNPEYLWFFFDDGDLYCYDLQELKKIRFSYKDLFYNLSGSLTKNEENEKTWCPLKFCLDRSKKYCFGGDSPPSLVPDYVELQAEDECFIAEVIRRLANYGFLVFYKNQQ